MPEIITRQDARKVGKKRFFTGEECPHGHLAEKYVANNQCVECGKISAREYQRRNKTNGHAPIAGIQAEDAKTSWRNGCFGMAKEAIELASNTNAWLRFRADEELLTVVGAAASMWKNLLSYMEKDHGKKQ